MQTLSKLCTNPIRYLIMIWVWQPRSYDFLKLTGLSKLEARTCWGVLFLVVEFMNAVYIRYVRHIVSLSAWKHHA